jgi:phospholipid/cholesterol/gamma-HCH transport system substrate-binding protein/paraquat-inducible protein B
VEESKRYVRLGLFVVVSLAVLAAGLLALGGRKWFQPTLTFETYFNQSVAGLELGAPVRFRGVPLGYVSEIVTSTATYERDVPIARRREYIVVRGEVNFSAREAAQIRQDVVSLVKRGLRAQTRLAGLTGQQYLALDFMDPQKNPPLEFPWKSTYTYVPSAPSLASEIVNKAQTFLATLNEADIKSLARNLNTLVVDLDKKVDEVPVGDLSAEARAVLANANSAFERIDRIVAGAPIGPTLRKLDSASTELDALLGDPSLRETIDNVAMITTRLRKVTEAGHLERTLKGVEEGAERVDVLLSDNQDDIRSMVQDLRVTSANLRVLSETLKRYPAGVLVAGPPAKVRLPESSP